jgi:hypothetical protein
MQDMRSSVRRQPVSLDVPPWSGMLDCWGHAPTGWWALVVWWEDLLNPAGVGHHPQACAAWAPARHVHPDLSTPTSEYADIPRIALATNTTDWLAPQGRPGAVWHRTWLKLVRTAGHVITARRRVDRWAGVFGGEGVLACPALEVRERRASTSAKLVRMFGSGDRGQGVAQLGG